MEVGPIAWSESGLYVATIRDCLSNIIAGDVRLTTSKLALHDNTNTPDYTIDPGTWTNANEVSGTGWAAGGVLVSAAASGAASIAPTLTQSPSKSVMFDATDVSVATTTVTNAYGLKWYMDALSPKAAICGIYFGGSAYTTSAGTFAITWAALGIWVIKCVVSGA